MMATDGSKLNRIIELDILAVFKGSEAVVDLSSSNADSAVFFVDSQTTMRTIASVCCKQRMVRDCENSIGTF